MRFEKRTRRPPKDPANALLSLAYTLLGEAAATALEIVGLDPYEGFYHADKYGRPALALDLREAYEAAQRYDAQLNSARLQLEAVREQGFAENDEEREPGVRTVAVPVLDGAGCATAAIAVQGPALRMTDERIAAILPALRQAASEAANRLALVG